MCRRLSSIVLSLLMAFSVAVLNAQWVGVDSRVANFFAVAQPQSEWCWAASSQLVLTLNGIPTTQSAIVQRIHHNLENLPGSDDDITAALTMKIGTRSATAIQQSGFPSPALLLRELSAQKPILIEFLTDPSSGHVVVITSAAARQTAFGPLITSIVLRDPWPSPVNVSNSGRVQIDNFNIGQFANTVRAYWLVSVSKEADSQAPDTGVTRVKALKPDPPNLTHKVPTQATPKLGGRRLPGDPAAFYGLVKFRPMSEAMPILLDGMKDSFKFERIISEKQTYAATGILYRDVKAYCFMEDPFSCGMGLFSSDEGPMAKAAYDELRTQLSTLMSGWTCSDVQDDDSLAIYKCRQKNLYVALSIYQQSEGFDIGLDLRWRPAPK